MQNLVYYIVIPSFLVYIILWWLYTKRVFVFQIYRSLNVIRYILVMPFWLFFVYFLLTNLVPSINYKINKPNIEKLVYFKNDMNKPEKIMIIKRIEGTNDWLPAYRINTPHFSPALTLKPGQQEECVYNCNNNDIMYALYSTEGKNSYGTYRGIALRVSIPPSPEKFYISDIKRGTVKAEHVLHEPDIQYLITYLLTLIAVWYHVLQVRRIVYKSIIIFLAANITLLSGFALFKLISTLVYFIF